MTGIYNVLTCIITVTMGYVQQCLSHSWYRGPVPMYIVTCVQISQSKCTYVQQSQSSNKRLKNCCRPTRVFHKSVLNGACLKHNRCISVRMFTNCCGTAGIFKNCSKSVCMSKPVCGTVGMLKNRCISVRMFTNCCGTDSVFRNFSI
jgi:hypothetical protein